MNKSLTVDKLGRIVYKEPTSRSKERESNSPEQKIPPPDLLSPLPSPLSPNGHTEMPPAKLHSLSIGL